MRQLSVVTYTVSLTLSNAVLSVAERNRSNCVGLQTNAHVKLKLASTRRPQKPTVKFPGKVPRQSHLLFTFVLREIYFENLQVLIGDIPKV